MNDFLKNLEANIIKNFSNLLNKLNPTEFVSFGSVIAIILIQYIDPNEQNTLGNFLEMIGQILLTSYAQATVTNPCYVNLSLKQGEELQKQINYLFAKINSTK